MTRRPATGSITTGLKRVVVASMAGTVVEWYEFFLYGTAATLVFNKIFFAESTSELNAILAAFAHLRGRFRRAPARRRRVRTLRRQVRPQEAAPVQPAAGRRRDIPDGLPADLRADRLLGARPARHAAVHPGLRGRRRMGRRGPAGRRAQPEPQRGFWASWPQAGVPVGNLLATVVLLVLTGTLSDEAFLSWGWRVAFWLSAVVVLVGYYIRTKVTDAPIFVAAQQEAERIKATSYSVVEVLKRYPRGVFTAMGLRFGENIMYYLVVTFSITYLKVQVGADTSSILLVPARRACGALRRRSRWSGTWPTASAGGRSTWSARSSRARGASSPSR